MYCKHIHIKVLRKRKILSIWKNNKMKIMLNFIKKCKVKHVVLQTFLNVKEIVNFLSLLGIENIFFAKFSSFKGKSNSIWKKKIM